MGSALITGASSGIGKAFAYRLAQEGNDLVLVARNENALNDIADDIRKSYGVRVHVSRADLSTNAGCAQVEKCLTSKRYPIGLLVNNAGFGLGQDFVCGDIEKEEAALNVMVKAVMRLSYRAACEMKKRGHGAIINISSMTALTAQGTYSAHKAWVKTFSEGLAEELRSTGVRVVAVCPGLVRSEFHQRSGVDASQWANFTFTAPECVVAEALDAVRHERVLVTPTILYKTIGAGLKIAPRWLVRSIAGPSRSGRAT
ncbi:MAG: SDR family NAD(P)-dependent oxidoreductase [Actinomycetaceae bacterium]|nr:SDR family NAD(P)-dependent oxidoreductase [Actinomycetaceae bacterium]